MGMKPIEVLREGIRQRKQRMTSIRQEMDKHLSIICDLREEMQTKEGEIYEYQQALS